LALQVMAAEGLRFPHIVGPDKGHAYDEASLAEVMRRCDREIAAGKDRFPDTVGRRRSAFIVFNP
jgi:hypothetical protein